MTKHKTATVGQFAELNSLVTRALPKAIDGLDIKETLGLLASGNGEQLSSLLHTALTSLGEQGATPQPTTPDIPTSFIVGSRLYDLVSFMNEYKLSVSGDTMVARAVELGAESGEEDGCFILEHQNEIPAALRGEIAMVFPKWRSPDDPRHVASLGWGVNEWCRHWVWLGYQWGDRDRLVRRRTVPV